MRMLLPIWLYPVYDGCSDDSDAFKGNAATADGIKNMVNLPRKSQYN